MALKRPGVHGFAVEAPWRHIYGETGNAKKQGVSYTQVPPKNEKLWNGSPGQTGVIELLPGGPVTARGYL